MSYHIYTTDGIILKRTASGEANITLYILTKDLGLILASARSARLSSSKLRPSLQEYSSGSITCIKAKNGWKVTNVNQKENFFFDSDIFYRKFLSQISVLLIKMITGEYPQEEIFTTIEKSFQSLATINKNDIDNLEVLTVLRVLYLLGYVETNESISMFFQNISDYDSALIGIVGGKRMEIVGIINNALKESQL